MNDDEIIQGMSLHALDRAYPITTPCISIARGKKNPGVIATIRKMQDGRMNTYEIVYQDGEFFTIRANNQYGRSNYMKHSWLDTFSFIQVVMRM